MIVLSLSFAVAAAGGTLVIRALAPQFLLERKPVSCDLCMSWWCSILAALAVQLPPLSWGVFAWGVPVFGAIPLSMIALKTVERLKQANESKIDESNLLS